MKACVSNKKIYISDSKILMALWDHDENENLDPSKILIGTDKKINWYCKNGELCKHKFPLCPRSVLRNRSKAKRKIAVFCSGTYRGPITPKMLKIFCPFCTGNQVCADNCLSTTNPEIAKQWDYHKNGNKKPVDYTRGSKVYIWWKCDKHKSYEARIQDRTIKKTGCPKCNASKGEKKIAEILNKMELKFKTQVKFPKCKNKQKLPFDFMVKIDEKRGFLIEYNGEQHYILIMRSKEWTKEMAEAKLRITQKHDKIKLEYANNNNIPLLIIPYADLRGGLSEEDMIRNFLKEVILNILTTIESD
jgi:hypothetical protein